MTSTIGCYNIFGVPSAGLQPHQIECDGHLLKELVLRARIEHFVAKCCADDLPMSFEYMARRFELSLTCDETNPPVMLSDLLREIRSRANAGSSLAKRFVNEYEAALQAYPCADAAIETIVHGLMVGRRPIQVSDFVRGFCSNHKIVFPPSDGVAR
ncbi:hypothetical protein [Bradyrhizobium genosp. A]|uniref:hypothetical protein n=1 Tax=Bradyrhizobium genosp. A TaxID=83626 RepID=UPI003CED7F3D